MTNLAPADLARGWPPNQTGLEEPLPAGSPPSPLPPRSATLTPGALRWRANNRYADTLSSPFIWYSGLIWSNYKCIQVLCLQLWSLSKIISRTCAHPMSFTRSTPAVLCALICFAMKVSSHLVHVLWGQTRRPKRGNICCSGGKKIKQKIDTCC